MVDRYKTDNHRINDLIERIKGHVITPKGHPPPAIMHDNLYEEIHDWMNVGLSSLALNAFTEAERLVDEIEKELHKHWHEARIPNFKFSDHEREGLRLLLFRYTRIEQSQWQTREELNSGTKIMNTRILETIYKGEPRLTIGNTYMEKDRIANYHGYWRIEDARGLINYLAGWLSRVDPPFKPVPPSSDTTTDVPVFSSKWEGPLPPGFKIVQVKDEEQ